MYKIIVLGMIAVVLYFTFQVVISNEHGPENNQIGVEFLVENGQKDDVQSTESGLQYKVLTKGDGTVHPTASSNVTVHYHGTLISGVVFDSSVDRGEPAEFGVHQVIPAWTEALQMMSVGDKWRIACPPKLAYGEQGAGDAIPPNTPLVFEVHLIAIKD
jgi:FKBP-type peptidyl-prolyl cis-trans isomerase FklB